MKTVTYTQDNFLLKDGEVKIGTYIGTSKPLWIATTDKSIPGIIHLERELFVKTTVPCAQHLPMDVNYSVLWDEESKLLNNPTSSGYELFISGFEKGYNFAMANSKGEFTRREVSALIATAYVEGVKGSEIDTDVLINKLRPLSLPKSIQVTDNDWNNPKIVWL